MKQARCIRFAVQCVGAALLGAMGCISQASPARTDQGTSSTPWYASWTASPFDAQSFPPAIIAPTIETVSNQTLRQTVTISRGGSSVRIRISNEFGASALHIAASSLGFRGDTDARTRRVALTFGELPSMTIPAGAAIVSDPVALLLPDGADLEISIYLPDETRVSTYHLLGMQKTEVSSTGDHTMADVLPGAVPFEYVDKISGRRFLARAFVSEVDLADAVPARTVVAFGDSITDGMGSTPNKNHRWPDFLARRVASAGLSLAVVNQGIGGNQVLANGLGVGALGRFDRDVLALPGASTVIVMEGINDIGFSGGMIPGGPKTDLIRPEAIIQGYRQLIARSHAKGLKILGATMTPFAGSPAFTPAREAVRQAVNAWIRTGGAFDGVIDFDRVTRDARQPDRLRSEYASEDNIHLNDAGYEAMASAVDLSAL